MIPQNFKLIRMGKSKKRDREKDPEERSAKLLKKVKKLNEEVEEVRVKAKEERGSKETDENQAPNGQAVVVTENKNGEEVLVEETPEENKEEETLDETEMEAEQEWREIVSNNYIEEVMLHGYADTSD